MASNIDKPIQGPHPLNLRDEVTHPTNLRRGADGKLREATAGFDLPDIEKPESAEEPAKETEVAEPKETAEAEGSLAAGVKDEQEERESDGERQDDPAPKKKNDVERRIAKEVKKRHELQRQLDEERRLRQQTESHLAGFRQRIDYSDLQAVTAREAHIKEARDSAQRDYRAAVNEQDGDKMFDATNRLAQLAADAKELEIYRRQRPFVDPRQQQQQQQQQFVQPRQQQRSDENDELAMEWAEENRWFGKDRALTSVAYTIDAELKEQGIDPNSRKFWMTLNKRLREEMPHKFKTERSPTQPVAGVSRSPATSRGKVALTESQKEMARRVGVTDEAYARFVPKE